MDKTVLLELLAPAKDLEHGIAAINYGADAVYIGAPRFGARNGAGNSVEDIEKLARYAHIFGAKVYVALNTIIYEDELAEAERIARALCGVGIDALIVQDMAFAEMSLPVPLHCSTQTFNMSPEKVKFFEDAGFSRVILERAANIDEIKAIRNSTTIELEAFVHGSICVCYSGQCYMSEVVSGRSGNRGECQQQCRWDYDLVDKDGKKLIAGKHLLSVNDLNLSGNMQELIDVGVTSFKIEGRLKDMTYLKNSVSYYRKELDNIILRNKGFAKSSVGECIFDFMPHPDKSFSRGFSTYFFNDKNNKVASFNTPKSVGEYVGMVESVNNDSFTIDTPGKLSNGDGISFLTNDKNFIGTNVNIAEGRRIFPNKMDGLSRGIQIYRNYNHTFVRKLENSKTRRAIGVYAEISMSPTEVVLKLTDSRGISVENSLRGNFEVANNVEKMRETIVSQLSKTGDTPFRVDKVLINGDNVIYITISILNTLRRETVDMLIAKVLSEYKHENRRSGGESVFYPSKTLSYFANVTNSLSEKFYRRHGVSDIEKGVELCDNHTDSVVMRTRYCIRREIGECLIEKQTKHRGELQIENNGNIFKLKFDCAKCEMSVIYKGKIR